MCNINLLLRKPAENPIHHYVDYASLPKIRFALASITQGCPKPALPLRSLRKLARNPIHQNFFKVCSPET
jgi:hypothetical protein